jgi:hypothetical protein
MTAAKPEQDLEGIRQRVEAMLIIYGNNVLTTQPIQGPGYVEPPVHVAMRANNYTDHFMRLVQAELRDAEIDLLRQLILVRHYGGDIDEWLQSRLTYALKAPQQPPTEGGSDHE